MSMQVTQELATLWNQANQLEKTNPTQSKQLRDLYWSKYRQEKYLKTELYMNS